MKFTILLTCLFLIPALSHGQNYLDSKIVVTANYSNIHERLKIALAKEDFIIKEDGNADTVTTYAREFKKIPGYAIARAEIKGHTITLTGVYGLKKINDWGYTTNPKNYKPILYYKGSHGWKLLMQIADKLDGKISYSK